MGGLVAWVVCVVCLSGWHPGVGSVGDMLAWVTCQHEWRGLRASVGNMLAWDTWVAC